MGELSSLYPSKPSHRDEHLLHDKLGVDCTFPSEKKKFLGLIGNGLGGDFDDQVI